MSLLEAVCVAALAAWLAVLAAMIYVYRRTRRTERLVGELRKTLSAALSHARTVQRLARIKERPRRRYVVFHYIGDLEADAREILERELLRAYREVFGIRGVELARPRIVLLDDKARCGVARIRHLYVNHLVGVMGLIRRVGGERILLIPVRATGTLRKAQEICRMGVGPPRHRK